MAHLGLRPGWSTVHGIFQDDRPCVIHELTLSCAASSGIEVRTLRPLRLVNGAGDGRAEGGFAASGRASSKMRPTVGFMGCGKERLFLRREASVPVTLPLLWSRTVGK